MRTAVRKTLSLMIVAALFAAVVAIPATAFAATGTKLTITASGKAASIYTKVKLYGTFKTTAGTPIKQVKLRLMKQASGETSWTVIAKPQTNSKGRALVNVRPAKDASYKFVYLGSEKYEAAESKAIKVDGYQPNTIVLNGTGNETETVTLQKGLATFSLESTSAPFKVQLYKGATLVSTLVDSVDAAGYTGETALKIAKTGKYSIIVSAVDGSPWTVKIVQPRKLKAKNWTTFSGTGDQVSDVYTFGRKSYTFVWTNPAAEPFKVVLRNQAGTVVKTIVPTTSAKAGVTHVIKVPKGLYILEVDAGDAAAWTITFKK